MVFNFFDVIVDKVGDEDIECDYELVWGDNSIMNFLGWVFGLEYGNIDREVVDV